MWRNITEELSLNTETSSAATVETGREPTPQPAAPAPQRRSLRRGALVLAAAVGRRAPRALWVRCWSMFLREPEVQIVASATLNPLPGEAGQGTTQLVRDQGSTELHISVTGSPPSQESERSG